jgi:hypothetical protein
LKSVSIESRRGIRVRRLRTIIQLIHATGSSAALTRTAV